MSKEQAVVWHQLLVKTKTSDERFFLVVVVQLFMCGPRNATMIYHWFKGYFFFSYLLNVKMMLRKMRVTQVNFPKTDKDIKTLMQKEIP